MDPTYLTLLQDNVEHIIHQLESLHQDFHDLKDSVNAHRIESIERNNGIQQKIVSVDGEIQTMKKHLENLEPITHQMHDIAYLVHHHEQDLSGDAVLHIQKTLEDLQTKINRYSSQALNNKKLILGMIITFFSTIGTALLMKLLI